MGMGTPGFLATVVVAVAAAVEVLVVVVVDVLLAAAADFCFLTGLPLGLLDSSVINFCSVLLMSAFFSLKSTPPRDPLRVAMKDFTVSVSTSACLNWDLMSLMSSESEGGAGTLAVTLLEDVEATGDFLGELGLPLMGEGGVDVVFWRNASIVGGRGKEAGRGGVFAGNVSCSRDERNGTSRELGESVGK
jgi:hypothetical protein